MDEETGIVRQAEKAVVVRAVHKRYGRNKSSPLVLRNIDVTVPKAAIYGLLGPSGCGKTTLLRCIVGRLEINQGKIITLGKIPGSLGHEVPGKRVGYMPQELALYNQFTIEETLNYFGRLHKMTSKRIKERTAFLLQFLHLPVKSSLIEKLSGGQQRRTSFAIALLQEPDLLVLDEPTVGVDPLLRQSIWEHLLDIAQTGNVTIIITTHYVEEARQAHMVGLMRNGRLLAEAPPNELIRQHDSETLEDVFLKLCEADHMKERAEVADENIPVIENHTQSKVSDTSGQADGHVRLLDDDALSSPDDTHAVPVVHTNTPTCCQKFHNWLPSLRNIFALFIKNCTILRRQLGFLLFSFFLPAFQIILFCVCIGGKARDLQMAVVNNETCNTCNMSDVLCCFSCKFLNEIDNTTLVLNNYNDRMLEAVDAVQQGKAWGIIAMGENFTTALLDRFVLPGIPSNETLHEGEVHVYLDMTNQQVTFTMQTEIIQAFQRFLTETLTALHRNPAVAELPVKIEEPIYGELNPSFTNFMAPGVILSITFFMATGLTALSFVLERKQGLLDRSFVAGVNTVEVMIGHICTQFLVMCGQVFLLLLFALAVFQVPYEGSLLLVVILTLLQGLTGMALGLLISTLCNEETSAIQCSLGSVYPNMLLSGIIWPIEAMPVWLRYISYALPMTFAADAMRSILARGWGLEYAGVWKGFVVSIGWGWFLMMLSAIVLRFRKG